MLIIYTVPISLYCAKLRIVLRHKKLKWEEQPPIGGYGSEEYKTIVPSGNLPALVDGNLLIADSEAIAEYLEERYPTPAMLPVKPERRAKTRETGRFHDTRLEPELRKLFKTLSSKAHDQKIQKSQETEINIRLRQLSKLLNPEPNHLFLGDCGYPISFSWLDALIPLLSLKINWPIEIATWRNKIEQFSAVKNELADYQPKLKKWLNNI
jgi:glutathione S-transferase/maleylpyruvate isomerase